MIEQLQNRVDDCVKMKTSDILQEERAQHSKRAEQLQFLLKETVNLRKENDALQGRESGVCAERDNTKKDLYRISLERFTHKKVRGQDF